MGILKRLDLLSDAQLERALETTTDDAIRDHIARLIREWPKQPAPKSMKLFKDQQGRTMPGYLTTSELIAELDYEPVGTVRHRSLAIEAVDRARRRAFPPRRVPDLIIFTTSGKE
jgi:hypothetical protein